MTRDQRRKRGNGAWTKAVLVLGLGVLIFGSVAGVTLVKHHGRDEAAAELWDIAGPACPEVTRDAFAALPIQVKSKINFGGMALGRAFGHVACEDVPYKGWRSYKRYPACQMTGPGVLSVAADGRETFFNPGFGNRVTIGMPDGELKCVIGGDFGLL